MSNDHFSFKQFTIYHDQCAMKVGTDGVMLGAWTSLENASGILDVGAGSGLITIMLAQRSNARIDGVEINGDACLQARENIARCPWKERIQIFHDSFQHFSETTSFRYDVIVSNPPFFRNSLKPPAGSKSIAKHDVGLDHSNLLSCASLLLASNGRLSVIIPAGDYRHLNGLADFHRFYPLRALWIKAAPGKDYSRCLVEFSKEKALAFSENELTIRQADLKTCTEDYIALTRDFYLKF